MTRAITLAEVIFYTFLSNSLFDMYVKFTSAKEIWSALGSKYSAQEIWSALGNKYSAEDVGKRKYVVIEFLKYQMVDHAPINDQIHQFQQLVDNLEQEGTKIDETFQIAALLKKLPPSWSKVVSRYGDETHTHRR